MRFSSLVAVGLLVATPRLAPALEVSGIDSEAFPLPDALKPAVRFWREIFARHASDRVVVHDRDRLEVIWQVIELPRDEHGDVQEELVSEVVRTTVEELEERLERLQLEPVARDEEDRILLALTGGDASRLAGASSRLRTQRGVADRFREALTRSRAWIDDIRGMLVTEGVPREIAVLPFVESMFNPMARSHAGAVGLWQLMPRTARELGLEVSRARDERLDVTKATRAAARMLRNNHRLLGSWPLALTGYNFGPYGIKRAVAQVGSDCIIDLIGAHESTAWGFAGKNFYAEFLAVYGLVVEAESELAALTTAGHTSSK